MTTPLEAAQKLHAEGFCVIDVPFQSKIPLRKEWQKQRWTADDLPTYFNGRPQNIGALCGEPSGGRTDTDLDAPEAVTTGALILPTTARIGGRETRPRSHYWHIVDEPPTKAATQFIDPVRQTAGESEARAMLLEWRSTRGQTIVHGRHPDGDAYVWDEEGEPSRVTFGELNRAVRHTATAALLARYWPRTGVRHVAAMAAAGFLLNLGVTEDDTVLIIEAAATAAGDDEVADRVEAATSTAKKRAADEEHTGGTKLVQLLGEHGGIIVDRITEWLGATVTFGGRTYPARDGGGRASTRAPDPRPPGSPPSIISAAALLAREFPPLRHIVEGILTEGLTLLAGKPKIGKSWIGLNLAVAVAGGTHALGSATVPSSGDVLLMCLEDGPRRLQARLRAVLRKRPAPERLSVVTTWPRTDEGGVEALDAWLLAHPDARLVVIDTAKRIKPRTNGNRRMYDEDYESLEALADLAKKHAVAIVVVHHTRKMDADDPLDLISGSTGLTGAADAAMVLRRTRGSADAELVIVSRDLEDQELALRWDTIESTWMIAGSATEARLSMERQAILRTLKAASEPMTPHEVAGVTGQPYAAIRKTMWRMSQEVGRDGGLYSSKGKYSLAPILTVIYGNNGNNGNSRNNGNNGNNAVGSNSQPASASPSAPRVSGLDPTALGQAGAGTCPNPVRPFESTEGLDPAIVPVVPGVPGVSGTTPRSMKRGVRVTVCGVDLLASDTWATPPEIFDPLDREFGFTLDPCAEPQTAKAARYFTPADDGLAQSWAGEVCWLNPPYSKGEVDRWLGKAWKEAKGGATVVALVPHDPSPQWWRMWVAALRDGQDPNVRVEVRELDARPKFLHPDTGKPGESGSRGACAVVIYRPAVEGGAS